eukprot:SAG11_NODE_8918_length_962_cov_1.173812_2_plen_87_part_00
MLAHAVACGDGRIDWYKDQKDYQGSKAPQGSLMLRAAQCAIVRDGSMSLLPRAFEVVTAERNLKAKTLEGQDATDWVQLITTIAQR